MKLIENRVLTGERALFNEKELRVNNCTFEDGESPLKESEDIEISNSTFSWKYPIWYSKNISVSNSTFTDTARSGIWYTENISIKDSNIDAPKIFRRAENISLTNCTLSNALESLWNCIGFKATNIKVKGDYFGFNTSNVEIDNFDLDGNYVFDGGKNIVIRNSKLLSKDAFWNCENVTIYDSIIIGEYFGWNSKNITLVNCTIESLQGFCYMENLVMKNCILRNTTLAFEYSSVYAEINSSIDSIKNPISGTIKAKRIDEIILEEDKINPSDTTIIIGE